MNDDQLRALLEDAVADVAPHGSLEDIRSRTTRSHRRRAWVWGAGGTVLAAAATIAVVAVLSGTTGTTDADPGPAGTTPPTGAATSATGRPARTVTAYFVVQTGRGPLLYPETYAVADPTQVELVVERAVTGRAEDPDYGTAWPAGTSLQKAQLSDGVLSVDLAGAPVDRPAGMSVAQAGLALDQAIRSAQSAFDSKLPVTFLLDGRPTPTLLGLSTGQPVFGASDEKLSPVQVDTPADGATVASPFTVSGRASSFEANVQWELKQGDRVVKQGFTTAEECCVLSPYSFEVTAPPGSYTLVVHDQDASGGAEGPGRTEDTKRVVVR